MNGIEKAQSNNSFNGGANVQNPTQTMESYTYDGVGNRTASHQSTSYSYQPFNKVISIGSNSYTYDNNGNLTQKTDGSGSWTYTWDYENRLNQVTRPDAQTITYKYDALGRRVQRTPSNGVSTNYIYDGEDVIKDINSDNSTVEYLNGLGIDDKLRQTSNAGTLYFIQDHLGSTRELTNASGNVVESINYDSFGNGASSLTRYGYTGREWDAEANLYYYRNRWYDPQTGRFISEDPIGLEGGINLFAYVGNDPVNLSDPSGLCPPELSPRCLALIKRMLKPLTELERLWKGYDPVKDFKGGYPIRKHSARRGLLNLGETNSGGHYRGLKDAQTALRKNYEAFLRECLDRNDNSNPGIPPGAREWAYKDIPEPYDPDAPKQPSLIERVWNWWSSQRLPTQQEYEKQRQQYPWLYPPAWFPVPAPR